MRFFANIITALLAGCLSTAQADQTKPELDKLFDALRESDNLTEISEIQDKIWSHWYELPENALPLQSIFDQGVQALQTGRAQDAVTQFSQVIDSAPAFAEAWNRRATTFFMLGDFESSLLDIRQTLILEPRHFGALSGLSMIFEATEQYERAIQTEQQLLNLMPNNELIEQRILRLQGKALKSRI
tara:strand:+ start:279 stop:836 length:558 start_codon:yes stop_codon:yes gene_type:complete